MSERTTTEHDYERITQGYDRALKLMQVELNKIGAERDALLAERDNLARAAQAVVDYDKWRHATDVFISSELISRLKDALNAR